MSARTTSMWVKAALLGAVLSSVGCSASVDGGSAGAIVAKTTATALSKPPGQAFVVVEPDPERAPEGAPEALVVRHAYSHARAEIRADSVRVTVTEVLVNGSDSETKASYGFPLPSDATVAGFADYRDGERIEATLGSREAARKAFDDAEKAGKQAALTETEGAMGFRMDLTPLAAHESRRVELTYVQALRPLGAERTFVYPAGRTLTDPATVSELDVDITAGRSLGNVQCPNQRDARIEQDGDRHAVVAFDGVGTRAKADVVVRWTEAAEPLDLAVRGVRAKEGEPAYVEARFSFTRDPYASAMPPRGFVLVLDTSLSMAGDAIDRARHLMQGITRNLSDQDRVALVTFSDELHSWERAENAGAATKQRLTDELEAAHAGGTSNLDAAIDRAHELLHGLPNPVLVLATDGQPTVGEDLDAVTPASPPAAFAGTDVRVALFNYPSRQKVLEALFPHVASEYVPSGPAGDDVVRKLADLVAAPRIENVALSLDGLTPDSRHGRVPPVIALGDSIRVAGRADGPVSVELTGTLHGKAVVLTGRLDRASVAADDPLPTDWARLGIAELEDKYRTAPDPATHDQIVALATTYHLVSSLTSLVATDSVSPDRVMPGDPEIRVTAPRGAGAVRAELPWGETVECAWSDDEGAWYGRFLVPRGTPDGLYRVHVFVDFQGVTSLRTTLLLRVDSKPPTFSLRVVDRGDRWHLDATPEGDVFDADGNGIRKDRVDLRSLIVRLGARSVSLDRIDDDHWGADVPAEPGVASVVAEIVATDYALNVSRTSHTLRVTP